MPADPLTDADVHRLQDLLDAVPAPLEPLDATALDGYLAGVVLQPAPVAPARWARRVLDVEGRPPPPGWDAAPLLALAERRRAEIERAVAARTWFDPWIFAGDPAAPPSAAVLPWVVGFSLALDDFPALAGIDDPELVEPMALLFMHVDPDDLDDADALLPVIETLEPPADLAEAVQDLVRALMLIADVSRPRRRTRAPRAAPARGRRSRSGRRAPWSPPAARRPGHRPATPARSSRR
jgi:uncharacterized protein